jgi:hypothetical protein
MSLPHPSVHWDREGRTDNALCLTIGRAAVLRPSSPIPDQAIRKIHLHMLLISIVTRRVQVAARLVSQMNGIALLLAGCGYSTRVQRASEKQPR